MHRRNNPVTGQASGKNYYFEVALTGNEWSQAVTGRLPLFSSLPMETVGRQRTKNVKRNL